MVNKTWSEHFQWCLMVSLDRHKEGVSKATTNFVPFPRIPSLLRLCDYVQRMITTRIIAALKTPSAGLLTIVGALPLLYTNPGHTQTYPSPLGQTTLSGPFSTCRNHKKSRVQVLFNSGEGEIEIEILVVGRWWFGASWWLTFALRCTEGRGDAGWEGKKRASFSQNLLLS